MLQHTNHKVALVLSSGGARGYAHIGAIEELEQEGFQITTLAGTSMGALVGGMYATGQLHKITAWLKTLNRWQLFSLVDLTLSRTHLIKVEKVLDAMREISAHTLLRSGCRHQKPGRNYHRQWKSV